VSHHDPTTTAYPHRFPAPSPDILISDITACPNVNFRMNAGRTLGNERPCGIRPPKEMQ